MLGSQGTMRISDNNKNSNNEKKQSKEATKIFDIDSFPNFFAQEKYKIYRPYDFEKALKRIEKLTQEELKCDIFKEQELDLESLKDDVSADLENVKILTMKRIKDKLTGEESIQFIELFDLKNITGGEAAIKNKLAKLIVKKDSRSKDNIKTFLTIKNFVSADKIIGNLESHFAPVSKFTSTAEELEAIKANVGNLKSEDAVAENENAKNANANKNSKADSKNFELDFHFNCNIIQKMYNEDPSKMILHLQSPPTYKTNFLIKRSNSISNKSDLKAKTPNFEYTICPFKNFENEISNLKLRNFFIYLEDKKAKEDMNSSQVNFGQTETSLLDIFDNYALQFEIDDTPNISIITESEYRKRNKIKLEIDEFFQDAYYTKNLKIYGFSDEQITALLYCTLVLVSGNILSYFNALDFINNLQDPSYFESLFFLRIKVEDTLDFADSQSNSNKNLQLQQQLQQQENFLFLFDSEEAEAVNELKAEMINLDLFIECFVKIIAIKTNSFCDLDLSSFEDLFRQNYKLLFLKFNAESKATQNSNASEAAAAAAKKKSSFSKFLIRSQRIMVTPTYTIFAPYTEDQGNRILREYLENPMDGLRLVFKMDDFSDARFNNILLIEYIKIYLARGIKLYKKHFEFYNYSQSQFRTLGCWMVIDPERILSKCGDFKSIKIVAKYGARIGQTLTSTLKTIEIPEQFNFFTKDIKNETFYDAYKKRIVKAEKIYDFSDGVGTISFDLAKEIADTLGLKAVPAAYQARYLGCKGVWTVIFDSALEKISKNNFKSIQETLASRGIKPRNQILIRDTQKKFEMNPAQLVAKKYFEVCNYAKFIKCYLNRQIILLLNSIGVQESVFMRKLKVYYESLAKEEFVLSLIQFDEWNSMFAKMLRAGITSANDRLMRFVISTNKDVLYKELKKRTRIFIDEGAYVIGIMDEFGILDYGEAFLRIKNEKLDLILDKKCVVTKCPCLHPGDIRLLSFKKYDPKNPLQTKIYQIFEEYENVLIFPSKGKRPHPNEIAGSDLDGDQYFVFYDQDLCRNLKLEEPMDYSDNTKSLEKQSISRQDVIEFFANYSINSNLGLIADAHMAQADARGAKDPICIGLAKKFALAVDAPKTGAKVSLDENNGENPEEFPHFMADKPKQYRSHNVLGKLHDQILEFIEKMDKDRSQKIEFFDESLLLENSEVFFFEALVAYMDYMQKFVGLLKINEIPNESYLLSGNNPDGVSAFDKKKHNYDLLEKLAIQLKENFLFYKNKFDEFDKVVLENTNLSFDNLNLNRNKKIITINNNNDFNKPEKSINNLDNININNNNKNNFDDEQFTIEKNYGYNNNIDLNSSNYYESKLKNFVRNNISLRASAYYYVSYNFKKIFEDMRHDSQYLNECFDNYCENLFDEANDFVEENENIELNDQINYFENSFNNDLMNKMIYENKIQNKRRIEKQKIIDKLCIFKSTLNQFVKTELEPHSIPKEPTHENQHCILSFPWSCAGNYLAEIKMLREVFN